MASLNTAARELVLKVVYYGPGLCGKTTTLQALHESAPPERRGKLVSLATPVDRTLYFDFLPLRLPPIRGLAVRLQLFTVPGQVYFNATRRLVLSGADGVVFVADSQSDRLDANLESLENLRDNLAEHGRELSAMPHAFAWNKRDLDDVVDEHELERVLNRFGAPAFGTVATRGTGAQETLDAIVERVLAAYEAQLPSGASASLPATTIDLAPPSVSISLPPSEAMRVAAAAKATATAEMVEEVAAASTLLRAPVSETPISDGVSADEPAHDERPVETTISRPPAAKTTPPPASARASRPPPIAERDGPAIAEPASLQPPPLPRPSAPAPSTSSGALTLAAIFPDERRSSIAKIEAALADGQPEAALAACAETLDRVLGELAGAAGLEVNDPALAQWLGVSLPRLLRVRLASRRARETGRAELRAAIDAFALLVDVQLAIDDAIGRR